LCDVPCFLLRQRVAGDVTAGCRVGLVLRAREAGLDDPPAERLAGATRARLFRRKGCEPGLLQENRHRGWLNTPAPGQQGTRE